MGSEKEVYIMRDDTDEEWVRPTPARTAIVDVLTEETDLTAGEIEDVTSSLNLDELRAVLETGNAEEFSFRIEDHEVRVETSGDITVHSVE